MTSRLSSLLPAFSARILMSDTFVSNRSSVPIPPAVLFLASLAFTVVFAYYALTPGQLTAGKPEGVRTLRGLVPFLGQQGFYNNREQWAAKNLHRAPDASFSPLRFNIKSHVVNAVGGLDAAKDFFHSRKVHFTAGYQTLFAGIVIPPREIDTEQSAAEKEQKSATVDLRKPPPQDEDALDAWTIKHIRQSVTAQTLERNGMLGKMAHDIDGALRAWWKRDGASKQGDSGQLKIFEDMFFFMFKVSMRAIGLTELLQDEATLRVACDRYWDAERNATFVNTHLSWLPLPGNRRRKAGGEELFKMFATTLATRQAEGRREEDYAQMLLDIGCTPVDVARWVMTSLFASIVTTSGAFTYTLGLAGSEPAIWNKLKAEIDETLARLSKEKGLPADASPVDKVAALTIDDLEDNFGFSYWCLRETIRMTLLDFLFRRVQNRRGENATVGGREFKHGEYVIFDVASVNLNPSIYPQPEQYDPERWERGAAKGPDEFVGWGAGLHPCAGMKLAKNEVKLALALVVSLVDVQPIDPRNGKAYNSKTFPQPHRYNNYRMPTAPLEYRYTLRHDV